MRKAKLAITLTSSALLAAPAAPGAEKPQSAAPSPAPALTAAQLAAMSKAEVRKLLARIASAKAPEPKMGAMCYKMAAPPERMEYVCPTCGEKTLYAREVSWTWTYELDTCRRLFKEMPKRETMRLDESCFCKKCQPEAPEPMLKLTIRFDDGTSRTTPKITGNDLRLLRDFLLGKLLVTGAQDNQSPIKDQLARLRELLGVKDE